MSLIINDKYSLTLAASCIGKLFSVEEVSKLKKNFISHLKEI